MSGACAARWLPGGGAPLRRGYQCVIVGGGCHGLSLAYNLARRGMREIAVFEKAYLGSGASGRNTALIRSAFGTPEWIRLHQESIRLWERLSDELDYNVMFTQRGYLVLAYTDEKAEVCRRSVPVQNALGVQSGLLDPSEVRRLVPCLNVAGLRTAIYQPTGGIARHDAVVWGYARAAARLGVEIQPYTEVTGIRVQDGVVSRVLTSRGHVETALVVNAAGGHSADIARLAGVEIPVTTYPVEAFVTEPLGPLIEPAINSIHNMTYFSQTSRGEIVGGSDEPGTPPGYRITSTLDFLELAARRLVALVPRLARASFLRQWGGLVDITPDLGPLLGEVDEVKGFVLDCGWGGYGFMGTPAGAKLLADALIDGVRPPLLEPFAPRRFKEGRLLEEKSLIVVISKPAAGRAEPPGADRAGRGHLPSPG